MKCDTQLTGRVTPPRHPFLGRGGHSTSLATPELLRRPRLGSGHGPPAHRPRLHRDRRSARARSGERGRSRRRGRARGALRALSGVSRQRSRLAQRRRGPRRRRRGGGRQLRPRRPRAVARRGRGRLRRPARRTDQRGWPAEGPGHLDHRRPVDRRLRVRLPRRRAPRPRVGTALPSGGALGLVLSSSVRAPLPQMAISNGLRPGLAMVAKTLADELGPRGVRVNGLLPGRIATDRVAELDATTGDPEAARRAAEATHPAGSLRRAGGVRRRGCLPSCRRRRHS